MKRTIDLNADIGEFDNPEALARDKAIMTQISSANIACGGHAGNNRTMIEMLEASAAAGVAAGAHPSYPDRANFGRTSIMISDEDLSATLCDQILRLKYHADGRGIKLTHVKPHGQLYNDAADAPRLAVLIAKVIARTLPDAAYVGLAGSEMTAAARDAGQTFIAEGFADRRYDARGRLVSRKEPGAVLENEAGRIEQALDLARGHPIRSADGVLIDPDVDSICLHSDSDGALASARGIRGALDKAGIRVTAPR